MEANLKYIDIKTDRAINVQILNGFDDPCFGKNDWDKLLLSGDTDAVNLTWEWQRSWWRSFGRGKLLLILAEKAGKPVALAPLFSDAGMIYNLFPEDALDFVGDLSDPDVLDALLHTARAAVDNFIGLRFYFIPDCSQTGIRLQEAATRAGLACYKEDELPSPFLNIEEDTERALEMTRKKSLRRHENYFLRNGDLEILHLQHPHEILPNLDLFFQQHIERRAVTNASSIFLKEKERKYYKSLTLEVGPTGWLRFTRINWKGQAIAFHFGLCYKRRYLYGIPSFDIRLSQHSPGEVLLRQVLLAAINENAATFDFGVGDEGYKYRFANKVTKLYNWGLYPQQK